jgi:UDP-2-acetamido-2-deoxy-ribo-hexuluronate aminotransferase
LVYYIKSLHQQKAYKHYPNATGIGLPVCEKLSEVVLSLPMHGYLDQESQSTIIANFHQLMTKNSILK